MKLHERLKIVREDAGLKQPDLAEKLGIPLRTYRSYEQGTRDISTAILKTICETLGVSSDFLIGRELPKPNTETQKCLAELVEAGDPSDTTRLLLGLPEKQKSPREYVPREDDIKKGLTGNDIKELELFAEFLRYRRSRQKND